MRATDFLLDEAYDLQIVAGDFAAGESDDDHVSLLLLLNQGELKQSPLTGIGLLRYQSGPMDQERRAQLSREATIQLERDGYKITTLSISPQAELTVDALRP